MRLAGKHLPPEFVPVKEIELEDVFLYYAKQEEKNEKNMCTAYGCRS